MTSELPPAEAVWIDAREAYARSHKPDPKGGRYTFADPFAPAAVIEADREAVRAPLLAEIDRLNGVINDTAKHWLDLQHDHPIAWEGAVDAAMEAACDEIRRLSAALREKQ